MTRVRSRVNWATLEGVLTTHHERPTFPKENVSASQYENVLRESVHSHIREAKLASKSLAIAPMSIMFEIVDDEGALGTTVPYEFFRQLQKALS